MQHTVPIELPNDPISCVQLLSQAMSTLRGVSSENNNGDDNNTIDNNLSSTAPAGMMGGDPTSSSVKGKTKQSKRLPVWLWRIIAKCLGIKLHPGEKPILSSVLHVFTMGTGAGNNQSQSGFWNILDTRKSSYVRTSPLR